MNVISISGPICLLVGNWDLDVFAGELLQMFSYFPIQSGC